MDYREELLKHVNQLLRTLKQILKQGSPNIPVSWRDETGKNIIINICLFDYFPGEDGEFEGSGGNGEDDESDTYGEADDSESLSFELTDHDFDFLRANGITF